MRVSVIILNYNGERFIPKLFETLAQQTFRDFEVIFVDNNSSDKSLVKLKECSADLMFDNKVKVARSTKNLGFCGGNNFGLNYASGELVVFLNNDTYLSPIWLEELVAVMDCYPEIGAAQSLIVSLSGERDNVGTMRDIYGWGEAIVPSNKSKILIGYYHLMGASMIIRRFILDECGAFDDKLSFGDYDLSLRVWLRGYPVATSLQSVCYHYGSVTLNKVFNSEGRESKRCLERVRIMLKCYSIKRLLTVFPTSFMIMVIENCYYTARNKRCFVQLPFTSILQNLLGLKDILLLRAKNKEAIKKNFGSLDDHWLTHYPLLYHELSSKN